MYISIMYDLTLAPAALASRPPPVGDSQRATKTVSRIATKQWHQIHVAVGCFYRYSPIVQRDNT